MKGYTDLQIQTVYSDGDLTPRRVVQLAKHYQIGTIAITDHDSVAGIDEAQQEGKRLGISVIAGIELYSTFRKKELHILGYNIRPKDRRLAAFLADIQKQHRDWLRVVVEKLRSRGWILRLDHLLSSRSQLIGFREIFREVAAHKKNLSRFRNDFGTITPDLFDFINRYFGKGGVEIGRASC